MPGKKNKDGNSQDQFGDLEDSFFAKGDDSDFWTDEVVSGFEDAPEPAVPATPAANSEGLEYNFDSVNPDAFEPDASVASGDDLDLFAAGPPSEEAPHDADAVDPQAFDAPPTEEIFGGAVPALDGDDLAGPSEEPAPVGKTEAAPDPAPEVEFLTAEQEPTPVPVFESEQPSGFDAAEAAFFEGDPSVDDDFPNEATDIEGQRFASVEVAEDLRGWLPEDDETPDSSVSDDEQRVTEVPVVEVTEAEPAEAEPVVLEGTDTMAPTPPVPVETENNAGEDLTALSEPVATPYVPPDGEGAAWHGLLRDLIDEAVSRADADAAPLWGAIAEVEFSKLGRWDEAEKWMARLEQGEGLTATLLRHQGQILASRGDFPGVVTALEKRAEKFEGAARAEVLNDAGLVARNQVGRPEEAIRLLRAALGAHEGDWLALRLLRDIAERNGDWAALVEVLGQMAPLTDDGTAASLQGERGRLLENALHQPEAAASAYRAALEAEPGSNSALVGLERILRRQGDWSGLEVLYRQSLAEASSTDRSFWLARVARARSEGGASDESVVEAWTEALSENPSEHLFREQQHWLGVRGLWAEVCASLEEEANHSEGPAAAYPLADKARLLERRLEDPVGAIAAWRRVLEADPEASPARDAIVRLLGSSGQHAELYQALSDNVDSLTDPNMIVTTLYRMGEICEGPLGDQEGAKSSYERILDTAPGYLPALEGLERVYTRLEAWEQLGAIYEQRAVLVEEPSGIALQLHRAGSVYEFRLGDHGRARDFYRRALNHVADFPPSLDAYLRILEREGDWAGLAQCLVNAADVSNDSNEVVSFTYRSARVLADCVGDLTAAMEQLRRCLELSPGFLPAISLLRELSEALDDSEQVIALQDQEADAAEDPGPRHWRLLAAAEAAAQDTPGGEAERLGTILGENPEHIGVMRFLEARAWQRGVGTVVQQYQRQVAASQDPETRLAAAIRAADLGSLLDDTSQASQAISEVAGSEGMGIPLVAMANVAESLGYWEHAQRILERSSSGHRAAARLGAAYRDDDARVLALWRDILANSADDLEAATGVERALNRMGSRDGLAEAHRTLARGASDSKLRAVHGLLAGHLFGDSSRQEEAEEMYRVSLEAQPIPGKAFTALRRLYVEREDAAGIAKIFETVGADGSAEHADALEEAGDAVGAATIYRALIQSEEGGSFALRLRLEHALENAEDWQALFEALGERRAECKSMDTIGRIEAKRRWILAEKLAETEQAWSFYRQLHEESPEDAAVLEALARIAGARGEAALAIQYLEGLSTGATESTDRARYQRRIAEAHLASGQTALARKAYHQALDVAPEDRESIEGLKAIAHDSGEWSEYVRVLAREASIVEGAEQLRCAREIARTWAIRIQNAEAAVDAWRKVLEFEDADIEALEALTELCRGLEDWEGFLDHGQALVAHGQGSPSLRTELGVLCLERLGRDGLGVELLKRACEGEAPSLPAATRLEAHYLSRGAYEEAVEAIRAQAKASEGKVKVDHLVRAAKLLRDTLRSRTGALEAYREVIAHDPGNREALRYVSDQLYTAQDHAGALEGFEAMFETEKGRVLDDFDDRMEVALYFYRYGESLRHTGRLKDAAARYRDALEANPNHLPTLEGLGPILVEQKDWEGARECYRKLLQLTGGQGDPVRLGRSYGTLGEIELALGNREKARKRIAKALEYLPDDVGILQSMANLVFEGNEWHHVLGFYNKIIVKGGEPEQVIQAFLMKSYVLDVKLRLTDKARQHYLKSLAFDGRQPEVLMRLAELALRDQDWPRAIQYADRGLEVSGRAPNTKGGLHLAKAAALLACGESAGAAMSLDVAREADQNIASKVGESPDDVQTLMEALHERISLRP